MTSETLPTFEKIRHSQLTLSARESLSGNWTTAVVGSIIFIVISTVAGSIVPLLGSILLGGPLSIGMARFAIEISRNKHSEIEKVFSGFSQFGQGVIAYLLYFVAIMAGFICLIIPGIVITLGLSQTFFILADKPNTSGVDALRESWDIMDGHKADYFVFMLRFFGWGILCIFTLFIGYFWLFPYMQVSVAKFYDMVRTGTHPDNLDDSISRHLLDKDLV